MWCCLLHDSSSHFIHGMARISLSVSARMMMIQHTYHGMYVSFLYIVWYICAYVCVCRYRESTKKKWTAFISRTLKSPVRFIISTDGYTHTRSLLRSRSRTRSRTQIVYIILSYTLWGIRFVCMLLLAAVLSVMIIIRLSEGVSFLYNSSSSRCPEDC